MSSIIAMIATIRQTSIIVKPRLRAVGKGGRTSSFVVRQVQFNFWSMRRNVGRQEIAKAAATRERKGSSRRQGLTLEKLVERRLGEAPCRADFLPFQLARFECLQHVGFAHAEHPGCIRRAEEIRNARDSCMR